MKCENYQLTLPLPEPFHNERAKSTTELYDGLRQYNTSSGAMIVLANKNKNKDFYTWFEQREPKKINISKKSDLNNTNEKRKKKRKNRDRKRKKLVQNVKTPLLTLNDQNIPIVKIMSGDEVICPGLIIHHHFVLASAYCVKNMSGLYIVHKNNMSIYQAYIYTEHSSHPLAIIQTVSQLPYRKLCFGNQGKSKEYK